MTPLHSGLADVRRGDRHPQPFHLVEPGISDVLRPPVTADPESSGDVLRKATEGVAHALAHRLERGPAIADLRRVPPDQLIDTVIDGAEEPAPAVFLGVEARRVGAPHLIRPRRGDRPRVGRVAVGGPEAPRREQLMGAINRKTRLPPMAIPRCARRARTLR